MILAVLHVQFGLAVLDSESVTHELNAGEAYRRRLRERRALQSCAMLEGTYELDESVFERFLVRNTRAVRLVLSGVTVSNKSEIQRQ